MWVRRVSLYRSLPLTAMESGLVSGPALATAYAVGIQGNDSYGGDSCYLFEMHQFKTIGEVLRYSDLHSGRPSSHFFLRFLHVMHAVLVRLINSFLRMGWDWINIWLRSLLYRQCEVVLVNRSTIVCTRLLVLATRLGIAILACSPQHLA